tara:strand:+ start:472 stop:591 length:120 start_codon:yes stop_codon:yes gene_type:complete
MKQFETDQRMTNKESFVGLVKGYTADAAYDIIGEKLRNT